MTPIRQAIGPEVAHGSVPLAGPTDVTHRRAGTCASEIPRLYCSSRRARGECSKRRPRRALGLGPSSGSTASSAHWANTPKIFVPCVSLKTRYLFPTAHPCPPSRQAPAARAALRRGRTLDPPPDASSGPDGALGLQSPLDECHNLGLQRAKEPECLDLGNGTDSRKTLVMASKVTQSPQRSPQPAQPAVRPEGRQGRGTKQTRMRANQTKAKQSQDKISALATGTSPQQWRVRLRVRPSVHCDQ